MTAGFRSAFAVLAFIFSLQSPPAFAQSSAPLAGNFLPQVLASSEPHRDSLEQLIKGKPGLPGWVRNMLRQPRYVALASETVEIDGHPMELFRACEAGRCEESALAVLFAADGKRAVLRIADERLGIKLFGEATEQELSVLSR